MPTIADIRLHAESDLKAFARLVNPKRVYGSIHMELFDWWQHNESDNTIALLPRDHQKSHCAATKAAWDIVKDPDICILYISATADLAEKQLYAIKNILDSRVVRKYWPDLLENEEGKREKWTTMEIAVDHPKRKEEGVRDPTVKAAGLTTNITGFHAKKIYLDDVVVPLNAYTEEGRRKVESMYSQLASIETTGSETTIVGTRYHPADLYATLLNVKVDRYEKGELVSKDPLFDVMTKLVEEEGEFLWPKMSREDGKEFGFDDNELAKKRAKYLDKTQYYAQYYQNPNRGGDGGMERGNFQYYSKKHITQHDGSWHYKDRKLNLFASIDFAFSLRKTADYTSIVVIGVDYDNNVYVLDIERFKTKKISEYFKYILKQYHKWGFNKMRAEVNVAQASIVEELRNNYIRAEGIHLKVIDYRPTRNQGTKEERTNSILEPRYDNKAVYHYQGGWCQVLEEELELEFPPHDDVKDSLASAIDMSSPPRRTRTSNQRQPNVIFDSRFGGCAY